MENRMINTKRLWVAANIEFALQHEIPYTDAILMTAQTITCYDRKDLSSIEHIFSTCAVCFYDYYRILSVKKDNCQLTMGELYTYKSLSELSNILDLFLIWKQNITCFWNAIHACYQVQKNPNMYHFLERLRKEELEYLNSIYPIDNQKINYSKTKEKKL